MVVLLELTFASIIVLSTHLRLACGVRVLDKQMLLIWLGIPLELINRLGLKHGVLVFEIGGNLVVDLVVKSIADEFSILGKVLLLNLQLGLLDVCAVTYFFAYGLYAVFMQREDILGSFILLFSCL